MKQTILKISAVLIGMIAVVIAAAVYIPGYSSRSVIKHYYEQDEEIADNDECTSFYETQSVENGQYGVRLGENWIIQPEYELIREATNGYVCKKDNRYKFIYNSGDSLNAFVIDEIKRLTYHDNLDQTIPSDLLLYKVDEKCGLIQIQENGHLKLLTEPLYEDIEMLTPEILMAAFSYSSGNGWIYAIMNGKGELINL